MKLIFIYGPPASGKLTIAKEVADISDITIFHNHLIRNLVNNLFETTNDDHNSLINTLRYETIRYAHNIDKSLICTLVYDQELDKDFVASLIGLLENDIYFIKLIAFKETLMTRVSLPDRREFGKIIDPLLLKKELEATKDTNIIHRNHIELYTDHTHPADNAQEIIKFITDQSQ